MSWMNAIGNLVQQYAGGGSAAGAQVHEDWNQVAQQAPQGVLADGIASAFRSDQTPPVEQMAAQMFSQAAPHQQAGLLNTILGAVGPSVASQVLGQQGFGGLSGLFGGGGVAPEQAAQVPPDAVHQLVSHAANTNPGIFSAIGNFVSQNPGLLSTLGSGVMSSVMGNVANRAQGGPQVQDASQDPYGDPADQMAA